MHIMYVNNSRPKIYLVSSIYTKIHYKNIMLYHSISLECIVRLL